MIETYLTPEETAQQLKIDVSELLALVEEGRIRAIRIGKHIRIRQTELDRLDASCAAVPPSPSEAPTAAASESLPDGQRWVATRTGRAKFRVSGSIAEGAELWLGRMNYPIKFPKSFMSAMLSRFRGQEVPVGGKFDDPGQGSLGEFIQEKLGIKMNPAVHIAALLIEEGYADASRRGYIRFRRVRQD